MSTPLVTVERPAAGDPDGLLVLHHGRGTDERDLIGLADALDPERRLRVVSARGPLRVPGWPGYHWYLVSKVGYPDRVSFDTARATLAEFHDGLWEEAGVGPERTVLAGFSMGAVMSHAMGWSAERPPVAGVLAFSGFVPTVTGWRPSFDDRTGTRAFLAHGTRDPVVEIGFGRAARDLLLAGGIDVTYRESDVVHTIDPADLPVAAAWLATTLPRASAA
jgi:phospholipase/carboxylesterase